MESLDNGFAEMLGVSVRPVGPVESCHLSLEPGIVAIYGRNGSGKSFLLRALSEIGESDSAALYFRSKSSDNSDRRGSMWWKFHTQAADPYENYWNRYHSEPFAESRYEYFDQRIDEMVATSFQVVFESGIEDGLIEPEIAERLAAALEDLRSYQQRREAWNEWIESDDREPSSMPKYPAIPEFARSCADVMTCIGYTNHLWTAEDNFAKICFSLVASVSRGLFSVRGHELYLNCETTSGSAMGNLIGEMQAELADLYGEDPDAWYGSTEYGALGSHLIDVVQSNDMLSSPWRGLEVPTGLTHFKVGRIISDMGDLLLSSIDDVERRFVRAVISSVYRYRRNLEETDPLSLSYISNVEEGMNFSPLLIAQVDGASVCDLTREAAETGTLRANEVLSMLLPQPPHIECLVRPLLEWGNSQPFRWRSVTAEGIDLDLGSLSWAEQRWARFAIEVASPGDEIPVICLVIDEPERGLHRRAEKFLAAGLKNLADSMGIVCIVGTHSPAFLNMPEARLHHLRKQISGKSQLESLPDDITNLLDELGLERADLLQMCRLIVVVEGEHDLLVLKGLFGDELAKNGVQLLAMRGLRNLAHTTDAQFIFRFTDARVMFLTDNEDQSRVNAIWSQLLDAETTNHQAILNQFTNSKKSAEAQFLKEFATLAVQYAERDRILFAALPAQDILDYLPVASFISGAATWSELRRAWKVEGSKKSFKVWLSETKGASFANETIEKATQGLDAIHEDLVHLLNQILDASFVSSQSKDR
jgi:predicted ATPase